MSYKAHNVAPYNPILERGKLNIIIFKCLRHYSINCSVGRFYTMFT